MINISKEKCLFKDILNIWLKEKRKDEDLKIQTYQRYECIINTYIKNSLGLLRCVESGIDV